MNRNYLTSPQPLAIMSPSTAPSNAPYTSIPQSTNRSSLLSALLFTAFLFLALGLVSQIPPTFPPKPLIQEDKEVATTKPPLILPEPPKPIEQNPEQQPIPDLVPVQYPVSQSTLILRKHQTLGPSYPQATLPLFSIHRISTRNRHQSQLPPPFILMK